MRESIPKTRDGNAPPAGRAGRHRSVAIEYRWGLDQYDRLAADLVRQRVAVIAATGGVPSVRAAKTATSAIPIVFTIGEIVSKRIALLRDLLPDAKKLAVLMNVTTPASAAEVAVAERVAHTLGWQVEVLKVSESSEGRLSPRARRRQGDWPATPGVTPGTAAIREEAMAKFRDSWNEGSRAAMKWRS